MDNPQHSDLICQFCGLFFNSTRVLYTHQTREHGNEHPDVFRQNSSLKSHVEGHQDKIVIFYCHICRYETKWKFSLESHLRDHLKKYCAQNAHELEDNFLRCKVCQQQFFKYTDLYDHQLHHANPAFICEWNNDFILCGYKFFNKHELVIHFESCHRGFKICGECGAECRNKFKLAEHKLESHRVVDVVAANEVHICLVKNYDGLVCGAGFYSLVDLTYHKTVHHFICDECKGRFDSRREIVKHFEEGEIIVD